ncbi:MAG: hypothetical protein JWM20_214 [Patescibacteria group bacterium]|nr:hypothetical protein [Patescibacteria group bacterium]
MNSKNIEKHQKTLADFSKSFFEVACEQLPEELRTRYADLIMTRSQKIFSALLFFYLSKVRFGGNTILEEIKGEVKWYSYKLKGKARLHLTLWNFGTEKTPRWIFRVNPEDSDMPTILRIENEDDTCSVEFKEPRSVDQIQRKVFYLNNKQDFCNFEIVSEITGLLVKLKYESVLYVEPNPVHIDDAPKL